VATWPFNLYNHAFPLQVYSSPIEGISRHSNVFHVFSWTVKYKLASSIWVTWFWICTSELEWTEVYSDNLIWVQPECMAVWKLVAPSPLFTRSLILLTSDKSWAWRPGSEARLWWSHCTAIHIQHLTLTSDTSARGAVAARGMTGLVRLIASWAATRPRGPQLAQAHPIMCGWWTKFCLYLSVNSAIDKVSTSVPLQPV